MTSLKINDAVRRLCKHPDPQLTDKDSLWWVTSQQSLPGKFGKWESQEKFFFFFSSGGGERREPVTCREDPELEGTFAYSEGFAVTESREVY